MVSLVMMLCLFGRVRSMPNTVVFSQLSGSTTNPNADKPHAELAGGVVQRKLFSSPPPPPPPHSIGYKGDCWDANVNQATRDSKCKAGYLCAREGYGGRKFGSCDGGWGGLQPANHCCSMVPGVKCPATVTDQKAICTRNGCGYFDNSLYSGDSNQGTSNSNEHNINVIGTINTASIAKQVFCCANNADVRQEGNTIVCSGNNDHCCDQTVHN